MALIHTSNNQLEDNGREIPFSIAAKKIKLLRVSSTGKCQNLYKKMPLTFQRQCKLEQMARYSQLLDWLNFIHMSALAKLIYKFSIISINITCVLFETSWVYLKVIVEN